MRLENKRIVLTGAASGIGYALAEDLARLPVRLLLVDRDPLDLSGLKNVKAEIFCFTGDMGDPAEVDQLFADAVQQMGGIDLFIANAGFAYYERINQSDWHHMETIFKVNVLSPLYAVTKMRELNSANPYRVVITASAMAHMAIPGYAYYAATKAALHRFADAYRLELPAHGGLTLVYPVATRTNFFRTGSPIPYPSQSPRFVARRILSGIRRDANAVYPATQFWLSLPLIRLVPLAGRLYQRFYARYLPK
ncbi:MAG: SDR family NAD(P)-dependent oxidoreductase [bacterium]|nr:SDR family NAD(P)-dependent oxidoreductase [bacterium]